MSKERATDLARQCTELVRKGKDFPIVWSTLLKTHALVEGIPRQRLECNQSLLDIPLITVHNSCLMQMSKNFVSDKMLPSGRPVLKSGGSWCSL